jgi:hypothetical protein
MATETAPLERGEVNRGETVGATRPHAVWASPATNPAGAIFPLRSPGDCYKTISRASGPAGRASKMPSGDSLEFRKHDSIRFATQGR